jgi:hypothetical protein
VVGGYGLQIWTTANILNEKLQTPVGGGGYFPVWAFTIETPHIANLRNNKVELEWRIVHNKEFRDLYGSLLCS